LSSSLPTLADQLVNEFFGAADGGVTVAMSAYLFVEERVFTTLNSIPLKRQ
jgi:hypothetical protein